jgi:hypothetical protein
MRINRLFGTGSVEREAMQEIISLIFSDLALAYLFGRVILHNLTGVPLCDELIRFVQELSHCTNNQSGSNVIWWSHQLYMYMNRPPSQVCYISFFHSQVSLLKVANLSHLVALLDPVTN